MLSSSIKLKFCLSVRHADNSPGTAEIDILTASHPSSSYFIPQGNVVICLRSTAGWKWRSGEKLEQHSIENHSHIARWVSSWLAFRRLQVWIQLVNTFSSKTNTFCIQVFLKSSFDSTVTWHSKRASEAKLNARHLRTRLWWLLMDICFRLFFTACWRHRHRYREKTKNSCGTFLSKPCRQRQRQTVLNQLSCGFNSKVFFSFCFFFQFVDLFRARFFFSDHDCLPLLFWHMQAGTDHILCT